MTCVHCVRAVVTGLGGVPGVTGADVKIGQAVVDHGPRVSLARLREAGVLRMDRTRGYIDPAALKAFKSKRVRFALTGALFALVLAISIAVIVLR